MTAEIATKCISYFSAVTHQIENSSAARGSDSVQLQCQNEQLAAQVHKLKAQLRTSQVLAFYVVLFQILS